MVQCGHASPPVASEFIELQNHLIPDWYRAFVTAIRYHCAREQAPTLALAPKPYMDFPTQHAFDAGFEYDYTPLSEHDEDEQYN